MKGILNRSELLLGPKAMEVMAQKRVLLVGVGGVGSWCAESLIRTGIRHLTIVDSDRICITNINRQLMATTQTVGQVKVEVLRERLLSINPEADIIAIHDIYSKENSTNFQLDSYDYIIDCIDSLKDKIDLLLEATRQPRATVFSSMGAALKLDPTRIQVAEFWKVKGCPLGSAMRSRMRRNKLYLKKKVMCIFSEELMQNQGTTTSCGSSHCVCRQTRSVAAEGSIDDHNWNEKKAQINGSLSHITGIYGFTLAGLVIQHIYKHL